MHTNHASSRGDLGFIPNQRLNIPSRTFFGSPGNPSKKGVAITNQVGRLPNTDVPETKEPTNESMVGKRTDWLEGQERKLTATLNETRSEQQRLTEQAAITLDTVDRLKTDTKQLTSVANAVQEHTKHLHMSHHWVYGHTATKIQGFAIFDDNAKSSLDKYRSSNETIEVSPENRWILLSYPMERVDLADGTVQMVMLMRYVDSRTAQISMMWAIVYQKRVDEEEERFVDEFAIAPH